MTTSICQVCGEGHSTEASKFRTLEHRGVSKEVLLCFSVCDHCRSETINQEQSVWNRRAVISFRKKVEQIPLGNQIRELRKIAQLTQAQAGALFGGGPVAFSKYENDDLIPDEAMSNLLRLVIADPTLVGRLKMLKDERMVVSSIPPSAWKYNEGDATETESDEFGHISAISQQVLVNQKEEKWKTAHQ